MRMRNTCIKMQELSIVELIKNNEGGNKPADKLERPE